MKRAGFNSMMITPESAATTCSPVSTRVSTCATSNARAAGACSACTHLVLQSVSGETRATVNETLAFVERALAGPQFLSSS